MESKLTRLTHKIAIQLHLVAEGYTICSSRSRRPVRKLLDTPSYSHFHSPFTLSLLGQNIRFVYQMELWTPLTVYVKIQKMAVTELIPYWLLCETSIDTSSWYRILLPENRSGHLSDWSRQSRMLRCAPMSDPARRSVLLCTCSNRGASNMILYCIICDRHSQF
jgi:hypothetical protein